MAIVMVIQESMFGNAVDVGGSGTCRVCKRPLTNPVSVALGIGPVCGGHNYSLGTHLKNEKENDVMSVKRFSDKPIYDMPIEEHGVVTRVETEQGPFGGEVRKIHTNVPHLVYEHSPSGFEIGYGGSGPADLALNVIEWYLRRHGYDGPTETTFDGMGRYFRLSWRLHQQFKSRFIATMDRDEGGEISYERIEEWMSSHAPELIGEPEDF